MDIVNKEFSNWVLGFSGCDGGDIGSPHSRSIWFCGIEWGGGHPSDEHILRNTIFSQNVELPPEGYEDWRENLAYPFNWQAIKLLTTISGKSISLYKEFAKTSQPFIRGAKGYFKTNLYPLAFKNTSHDLWQSGFAKATGIATKNLYWEWIKANRFPIMRAWVETYHPKLIVCVGKSYSAEFKLAFVDNEMLFNSEFIDNQELKWAVNKNGTVVVVIPFMLNRHGLTKNSSIQQFGDRIREIVFN